MFGVSVNTHPGRADGDCFGALAAAFVAAVSVPSGKAAASSRTPKAVARREEATLERDENNPL
jgi:hypothetical protein